MVSDTKERRDRPSIHPWDPVHLYTPGTKPDTEEVDPAGPYPAREATDMTSLPEVDRIDRVSWPGDRPHLDRDLRGVV